MAHKLKTSAADFLPSRLSLTGLRRAADHCQGCDLHKDATQTVFGEGPRKARLMLVGEMPGDREDIAGEPFVGPAGALLDQALEEAGLERNEVYVTNVVKHFRWEPRGKRRLHKKPGAGHIEACRPWLQAEILLVKPPLIVCLGATAAQALLGRSFRVTKQRGKVLRRGERPAMLATYHPAAILRAQDDDRNRMRREFTGDLRRAREAAVAMKTPPARRA
jgi:uracil-DNA glycosylase family protein